MRRYVLEKSDGTIQVLAAPSLADSLISKFSFGEVRSILAVLSDYHRKEALRQKQAYDEINQSDQNISGLSGSNIIPIHDDFEGSGVNFTPEDKSLIDLLNKEGFETPDITQ